MATTAADIISRAFGKIGIDDPTTAQKATALEELNDMISLWGADFMVPAVTSESFTMTQGQAEYTIGSGSDFDTVRPISVHSCYLRNSDGYDYPIHVMSSEDYNGLVSKDLEGRPTELYFLPEVTEAKIIFNKEIDEAYDAHFEFWKNFTEFALSTTGVTLPPEYRKALIYNLAVDLADSWDRKVSTRVLSQAGISYALLKRIGYITRPAPRANFDFGGRRYNINTDEGA